MLEKIGTTMAVENELVSAILRFFFNRAKLAVITFICIFNLSPYSKADVTTWNDWRFNCSEAPIIPEKPVNLEQFWAGGYISDYQTIAVGTREFTKDGNVFRANLSIQTRSLCETSTGRNCKTEFYHILNLESDLSSPATGPDYTLYFWKKNSEGTIFNETVLMFGLRNGYCNAQCEENGFTSSGGTGRIRIYPEREYHAIELSHSERGRIWIDELLLDDMGSFPAAYRNYCEPEKPQQVASLKPKEEPKNYSEVYEKTQMYVEMPSLISSSKASTSRDKLKCDSVADIILNEYGDLKVELLRTMPNDVKEYIETCALAAHARSAYIMALIANYEFFGYVRHEAPHFLEVSALAGFERSITAALLLRLERWELFDLERMFIMLDLKQKVSGGDNATTNDLKAMLTNMSSTVNEMKLLESKDTLLKEELSRLKALEDSLNTRLEDLQNSLPNSQ